jgi:hypothetical protein
LKSEPATAHPSEKSGGVLVCADIPLGYDRPSTTDLDSITRRLFDEDYGLGSCCACVTMGFILSNLAQPQLRGQDKTKTVGRTKWEYKVSVVGGETISNTINEAGDKIGN